MTFSDESDTTVIEFKGELIYSLHVLCVLTTAPRASRKCLCVCVRVCVCVRTFVCSSQRQTWERGCVRF
jgi:hypothetical protein